MMGQHDGMMNALKRRGFGEKNKNNKKDLRGRLVDRNRSEMEHYFIV
jgi:hypothetical protein